MEASTLYAATHRPIASHKPCAVCGTPNCEVFYEVHNVPTQTGILWPTAEAARTAPTTDVRLAFCPHCHYIGNEAYEPAKVTHTRNDFSLEFSPSFRAFAQSVAQRLIEHYQLQGGRALDIGCGDGDFLRTLCRLGMAEGVGIDPGYAPRPGEVVTETVRFIKDYFGPSTAHEVAGATLISCRHMLDILPMGPAPLLRALREAIPEGEQPLIYVEDPNALYNIGEQVVWNIVNEHSSWMTPGAQTYLFRSCGFEVLEVETCWHNEYLGVVARPAGLPLADPGALPPTNDPSTLVAVHAFAEAAQRIIAEWQERVEKLQRSGKRVVGWAAGSRAISFLNTFDLNETVVAVVDINPRRQGQFMPGTAHPVICPNDLMAYHPDVILITNPTYVPEIQEQARQIGFTGEFLVL